VGVGVGGGKRQNGKAFNAEALRTPASADSSAKRDLALTGGPPGEVREARSRPDGRTDGQRTARTGGPAVAGLLRRSSRFGCEGWKAMAGKRRNGKRIRGEIPRLRSG